MSRELLSAALLLAAALTLRVFGGWLMDGLTAAMQHGLTVDLDQHAIAGGDISDACREVLTMLALIAAPVLLIMGLLVLAAVVGGYLQIGFKFSTEVLGFKLERINPLNNWRKLFNMQAVVRTAFAAVKLAVLVAVLWLVLRNRWQVLMQLHEVPFPAAVATVADMAFSITIWVAIVVFAISAVDLFWQRFDFEKRNMMTRQEVEDERKRSEGDPFVKGRLRQARMELMRHRMMEAVPKADVIITNPTHFSVAIRYDRLANRAPEVVAKGVDELALRIRELARENDVPLMEDPPLARALYRAVKVGQEVPEKFYQAVAAVLSHVYQLKGRVA
jgi:flagellar biosynthesis protein FlhB